MNKIIIYSDDEREFISKDFCPVKNQDKYTRQTYLAKEFNSIELAMQWANKNLFESISFLNLIES